MKRKKLVLAVSAAVLLGGYTVGIFGQTEGDLTQKQIDNPNTLENKEEIARSVLESTGRSEQYDLRDLGDVTVYLGSDVTGNPQDAIVTVSFRPKTLLWPHILRMEMFMSIQAIWGIFTVCRISALSLCRN